MHTGLWVIRRLYSLLLYLLAPLLLAWMAIRARRAGGHWAVLGPSRFGHYPRTRLLKDAIWVHAVSLGETRAAHPLIRELITRGHKILLSHMTASGWAEGQNRYANEINDGSLQQVWLPYDFPGAGHRFLQHFRPRLGVLVEREIWPNLMHASTSLGVPVILASARMSASSLRGSLRLHWLMRPAYAAISRTFAQSINDARRLEIAGARHVCVSGNFKFDVQLDQARVERGGRFSAKLGRRIIAIASTREGEDILFVQAIRHQLERWRKQGVGPGTEPLFFLIPRHPQRFDAAATMLDEAGLSFVRRSHLLDLGDGSSSAIDACREVHVILGDTLGEMHWYYACSQIAIVGGSFAPLGGQNFIEASALGCPVIVGPHTANFEQAVADALRAGAIVQEADPDAAVRLALAWLDDAATLQQMSETSRHWVSQHSGAVARVVNGIEGLL